MLLAIRERRVTPKIPNGIISVLDTFHVKIQLGFSAGMLKELNVVGVIVNVQDGGPAHGWISLAMPITGSPSAAEKEGMSPIPKRRVNWPAWHYKPVNGVCHVNHYRVN